MIVAMINLVTHRFHLLCEILNESTVCSTINRYIWLFITSARKLIMRIDGIRLFEGSQISNATVQTGTEFPARANSGELFFRTDLEDLFLYNGTTWVQVSGATIPGDDTDPPTPDQTGLVATITLSGMLGIPHGGTGKSNQIDALHALLPPQEGKQGLFLGTSGQDAAWMVPTFPTTSHVFVNASRTDTYFANGSISAPYKTIADAMLSISSRAVKPSSLNPVFIVLMSSIVEDVVLSMGGVYLTGFCSSGFFAPIYINGTVTVNGTAVGSTAIYNNVFSITNIAINAAPDQDAIFYTGQNPQQLKMHNVALLAHGEHGTSLHANNTAAISPNITQLVGSNIRCLHNGGDTHMWIDGCTASFTATHFNGPARAIIVGDDAKVTLEGGAAKVSSHSCFVVLHDGLISFNNYSITNAEPGSSGISLMNPAATAIVNDVQFDINNGGESPRAVAGIEGSTLKYGAVTFADNSCSKIDSIINSIPLVKQFTTV